MGHNRDARETYKIKKIFGPTIQGEGSHIGKKVLFIRFAGCNRWSGQAYHKPRSICSFCDTDFLGGREMTAEEILAELKRRNMGHHPALPVVFSGGEPTLQVDERLIVVLDDFFKDRHIETNGSRKLVRARSWKHISMSPKQSRERTKLQFCHDLKILYPYVSEEVTLPHFLDYPCKNIYLQPMELEGYNSKISKLNRDLTIDFIMKTVIKGRSIGLSAQIHKLLEVE